MFTSPTAWGDLYGPPPPPPPVGALLQSAPHHLFSSVVNNPYAVASQPVREFPPLPPPAPASSTRWTEPLERQSTYGRTGVRTRQGAQPTMRRGLPGAYREQSGYGRPASTPWPNQVPEASIPLPLPPSAPSMHDFNTGPIAGGGAAACVGGGETNWGDGAAAAASPLITQYLSEPYLLQQSRNETADYVTAVAASTSFLTCDHSAYRDVAPRARYDDVGDGGAENTLAEWRYRDAGPQMPAAVAAPYASYNHKSNHCDFVDGHRFPHPQSSYATPYPPSYRSGLGTPLPPQDQQQHRQPLSLVCTPSPTASPYLCISDGARHLNAVRHRSAASAGALFLNSSSPLSSSSHRGAARHRSGRCEWEEHDIHGGRRDAASCCDAAYGDDRSETSYMSWGRQQQQRATSVMSSATTRTTASTTSAPPVQQTEPCCVAALIFNSAKEVGVALCELPSLTISLLQYGDTAAFYKTTSLLHTRNPVEVLVPSTAVESELVQTLLAQHGSHMTFTSVQRCFYHAEEGVRRLSQLKSTEEAALCIEDTDRYLCVAAANALVLYMEHVNDMVLLPGSVRVRAEALEHFMEMSRTTARALQIIADGENGGGVVGMVTRPAGKRYHGGGAGDAEDAEGLLFPGAAGRAREAGDEGMGRQRQRRGHGHQPATATTTTTITTYNSVVAQSTEEAPLQATALVDAIPRACTLMGQRYLRRTLLQPLRDRTAIQGRHDAVEWLLQDARRVHTLRALLRRTSCLDLERLTATLSHQPRCERNDVHKQSYLESLLLLWSALPYLEQLHTQLTAYLGPSSVSTFSQDSSGGNAAEKTERSKETSRDPARESSPAYPAVLHSVAATLRRCRFTELISLMSCCLEKSVLPSVVQHYEQRHVFHGDAGDHDGVFTNSDGVMDVPASSGAVDHPDNGIRARRNAARRAAAAAPKQQKATTSLLRILRMCFLVQAPRGGELDALRTRLSARIADVTRYAAEMRQTHQLYTLRLEPDPVKLYCLSYLSSEEAKTAGIPFTWRYAGGSHFVLYLAALRQQQERQQQQQQQQESEGMEGEGYNDRSLHLWHSYSSAASTASTAGSFHGPTRRPDVRLSRTADDTSSLLAPSRDDAAAAATARTSERAPLRIPLYDALLPTKSTPYANRAPDFAPHGAAARRPPLDVSLSPSAEEPSTAHRARRRRRIRCSTEELEHDCARTQECVSAILQHQVRLAETLVQEIRRGFLGALQATVESVALLDALLSFALYALTHQCTRPVLVELRTGQTTAPEMEVVTVKNKMEELQTTPLEARAAGPSAHCGPTDDARGRARETEHSIDRARVFSPTSSSQTPPPSLLPTPPSCTASDFTMRNTAAANSVGRVRSDDGGDVHDSSTEAQERDNVCIPFFVKGACHPSAAAAPGAPTFTNTRPRRHVRHHRSVQGRSAQPRGAAPLVEDDGLDKRGGGGLSLSWGPKGDVCVITGPNACGKTTLLRILGQHFTLAQAGCFVPARQTQLFLSDRLVTHMLCDELPTVAHSSFKRELMELNELTHAVTNESVVFADELGRSTTTAQGFSLAWATALFLSNRRVHTVLTTHFAGLPSLTQVRPTRVVAFHFRVSYIPVQRGDDLDDGDRCWRRRRLEEQQQQQQQQQQDSPNTREIAGDQRTTGTTAAADGSAGLMASPSAYLALPRTIVHFGHELFPGPCPQRWYGLALAERIAFFEPVLAFARQTRACQLQEERKEQRNAADAG